MPLSIHGTNGITFNDGSTQNTRPAVGFRNRIINGDMRIDQRNAGASVSVQTTTTYIVDRWSVLASANSKFTVGQNLNSITPPSGFSHYFGVSVASSANVTVGSTDQYLLRQGIEGFNGSDLAWGTSSASPVTLSFWVRSSVTGTFSGSLNGGGGGSTYSYPFTYSISSSNTWERKTITISGSQNGTWATDNSLFTWVGFSLGVGSTYSGTASAWSNSYLVGSTGSVKLIETNSATFYITGVQLEEGSTATDFERRPYGTELALCRRYYYSAPSSTHGFPCPSTGGFASIVTYYWKVSMRATPTITHTLNSSNNLASNSAQDTNTDLHSRQYVGSVQTNTTWSFANGGLIASAEL